MVQQIVDQSWKAEVRGEGPKRFIKDIKRLTRCKFSAKEKIRIVLEGFRREIPIGDLCQRENIHPTTCYAWLKDFMLAGKERLNRDTVRDAFRSETHGIKRDNVRLKHMVAELSLQPSGFSSIIILKMLDIPRFRYSLRFPPNILSEISSLVSDTK